jgi:Rieske Fe-S protein
MLAGVGLASLAGPLAGCSGGTASTASATASSSGGAAAAGGPGGALTSTGAIPVGGGKIFASERVVVTQPSGGQFRGFSAVCTHMQCIVDQIADRTIDCPCHGSKFSITDGHVVAGPAPSPLPAQSLKIESGRISLA